jgi:hypothetical protein
MPTTEWFSLMPVCELLYEMPMSDEFEVTCAFSRPYEDPKLSEALSRSGAPPYGPHRSDGLELDVAVASLTAKL